MTVLTELQSLLKKDKRLVKGSELLTNTATELALKMDKDLIKLLLSEKKIKEHFFVEAEGALVFDKEKFIEFISTEKFLPDSYTKFKQNIGLSTDDEYLVKSGEVVLSWPYKDCILEGGQEKEDEKRKEIFYNEILAPDEIDRLLDPKVFTNFKRIDAKGEHKVTEIKPTDNLIIKGNNLLVLHSLVKRFAGEVKLIYIDPPYNTRGAANTFMYNNTFNHSSWLTFMKNRIEAAKKFLTKDGIMVVAIDHFELFYLGILLDELFGRENRMGVIAVVHNPGGRQDDKFFPTAHENMLFYANDISLAKINSLGSTESKLSQFKYSDKFGAYKLRGFRRSGSNSRREDRPGLFYPIYYNPKNGEISLEKKGKPYLKILPIDEEGIQRCWRWGPKTLLEKYEKYIEAKKTKNGFEFYTKERESDYVGEKAKTIWDKPKYTGQTATHELKSVFGDRVFSYPKSPYLMSDVIKITTSPNDIVMDFFAGSSTTGAVAHKMGRQYILVEQMDYAKTVTRERIKKVIEGDQTDISKSVNWKGGGDFVYCELKELNELFVRKLLKAKSKAELLKIWNEMKRNGFLSYRVDKRLFDENTEEFKKLPLDKQRRLLIECLDKNHLYVNYSEIEDKQYKVSKQDIAINRKFCKGT
jgi:adenine-specific DNA-methyltransferase